MTIVEFFDTNAVENIVSALLCAPEKVVLVGSNVKQMDKAKARYEEIVKKHVKEIPFSSVGIDRNNLDKIIEKLEEVVEENGECTFDLTGGDDLYLVAVGAVFRAHPDKVQLHRFNIRDNKLYDCDADGNTLAVKPIALSIEDSIKAYGGRVVFAEDKTTEEEKRKATYRWNFDEDFFEDILNLWAVCKRNLTRWNVQVDALAAFHEHCERDHDALSVSINIAETTAKLERKKALNKNDEIEPFAGGLYRELETYGLIHSLRFNPTGFEFTYKNSQTKRCFYSAGQALELFVTMKALQMRDANGNPLFNDVMTGVTIDWDGKIEQGKQDVENEVDVILMKGLIPYFISCKNGRNFTSEELYKLSTVAEHFGGQYAQKLLVATQMQEMHKRGEAIANRAKAMGISVIENIDSEEDAAIQRLFEKFAKGCRLDAELKKTV